jgi:HlyD family secretion protein
MTWMFNSPLATSRRFTQLAIAAALIVGGGSVAYGIRQFSTPASRPNAPVQAPAAKTVTALGRVEPKGEIIKLAAPSSVEGARIDQLLVKEGDRLRKGQIIAILDSRDRLQAALDEANGQISIAQAKLAQVQAGAKQGEIRAQQSTVARIKAQGAGDLAAQQQSIERLRVQLEGEAAAQQATLQRLQASSANAQAELDRYQALYTAGGVSQSMRDSKRLALDTAQQQVKEAKANLVRIQATSDRQISEAKIVFNRIQTTGRSQVSEAKSTLDQIAEVRPVDVQAAQAEVARAIAAARQAKVKLDQTYIRAPLDSTVLDIGTRAGELASTTNGIVELGQTEQMYVIAEVYESDVGKVKLGQLVKVTAEPISSTLMGTVERVGAKVQRQQVVNTDPSANIDARIVEVHIKLNPEASPKAALFTNLQVKAVIQL